MATTTTTPQRPIDGAGPPPDRPPTPRRIGPAAAVGIVAPAVVLAIGMVAAVNLAIPSLQAGSLRPSSSDTAWIVDSYTLVFACLLIPAGALGDRFGRKRGMLLGLGLFAAGSVAAAVAPSVGVLMAGRALTGVGAALVLPATLAVTLGRLVPADRPHAIALWSAATGVGGVLGNLGGGALVELGGWRSLFWAGVPLALAAAALVAARVPEQDRHDDPVDHRGALLLTAGTVALLYGVIEAPTSGWGSTPALAPIAAGLLLLVGFAAFEARQEHPMLDPRLFRRTGVRAGSLGLVAIFFALFGLFYVNAQYLQDVKGYSALLSGVCILPVALAMPVTSARSTMLAARFGSRATVAAGMFVLAVGLTVLSFATAATPYPVYGAALAVVGAGMGLAMPPLSGMIVRALPASHAGVGSGLNSTTRELGSALGVAVLSSLLASRFSGRLPAGLLRLPGVDDDEVRHSAAAALHAAASAPDPALRTQLLHQTRDAFCSGTSLGLRVGVVLVLLTAVVVTFQHPTDEKDLA